MWSSSWLRSLVFICCSSYASYVIFKLISRSENFSPRSFTTILMREAEEKLCQLPPAGLGLVKRAQIKENCKGLWASRLYFLSLWCFVGAASGGREGSLEREKEIRLSFSSTLEVKKALCCCCYSLMLQVSSFFLCLRHATKKIIRQSSRGASELHFTWERDDAL